MSEDKNRYHQGEGEAFDFQLPSRLFGNKNVLKCIDCHAGGEPARVVLSGVKLPSKHKTALQKRAYMMEHLDHLRKLLLLEPRGYPCQNVNFIFPPTTPGGNLQYVIGEQNKIYPLMSGHNTICVATALLETGVVPMVEPTTQFTLEAPAGPIEITAKCQDGKALSVALKNAPSFVERLDVVVDVQHDNIGKVTCDIAYGGMWYCVVNLEQFQQHDTLTLSQKILASKLTLDPNLAGELCRIGEMIKVACREQFPVQHPDPNIDYPGVDILVFRETPQRETNGDGVVTVRARNTVVMSNNVLQWDKPETWTAMLDRSPCGTGTCAVMAVMHAKGELKVGERFEHESIVGAKFIGAILEETALAEGDDKKTKRVAILPQVEGSGYITQYSEVVVDPLDPFPEGYRVGDIW